MNRTEPMQTGQHRITPQEFRKYFLPYRNPKFWSDFDESLGELEEVIDCGLPLVDQEAVEAFIDLRIQDRPQLLNFPRAFIAERLGFTKNGRPTRMALLVFGLAPEVHFPNFSIRMNVHETTDRIRINERSGISESFRIDGTIPEMADTAIRCMKRCLRTRVYVTGAIRHEERLEVPEAVLREVILNALVHRDYSRPSESLPTEIDIFPNRIEVVSPGSLYGDTSVVLLGEDIYPHRNPCLVRTLERLHQIGNRGSGIPMIRCAMKREGLPEPRFISEGDRFIVILDRPAV